MKCDMCGEEKSLFEERTGVCIDCYNNLINVWRKNDRLEEKVQNLEMSLNEAKDTADAFYRELKVCKRALELACYYMEYEYPKKNDDIYYRKEQELEMIFLDKAKKELEEEDAKD